MSEHSATIARYQTAMNGTELSGQIGISRNATALLRVLPV
jgi:hypothetical protein